MEWLRQRLIRWWGVRFLLWWGKYNVHALRQLRYGTGAALASWPAQPARIYESYTSMVFRFNITWFTDGRLVAMSD